MVAISFVQLFAWAPEDTAARYRVRVYLEDGRLFDELFAQDPILRITYEPGTYRIVVHPIDADGVESAVAIVNSELVVKK